MEAGKLRKMTEHTVTKRMAKIIASRHKAGESVPELADDYMLPRSIIRRVIIQAEPTQEPA